MRGLQSTQPLVSGVGVDEELIARSEIVALPFTVSDIAETLARIEHRLREEDDGEEPTRDTHELAERAQAKLDAQTTDD